MSAKVKTIGPAIAVIVILVGWGISWANQNAKIHANSNGIKTLTSRVVNVSSQATEADKAIVRMETKIEYIIKGIDEIKSEVKNK